MQAAQVITQTTKDNKTVLSRTYCIIGTFLADEGNLLGALEKFNLAIKANSNNVAALFSRATVKIDLGDIEGARNDFIALDKLKNETLNFRYEIERSYSKTNFKLFA